MLVESICLITGINFVLWLRWLKRQFCRNAIVGSNPTEKDFFLTFIAELSNLALKAAVVNA